MPIRIPADLEADILAGKGQVTPPTIRGKPLKVPVVMKPAKQKPVEIELPRSEEARSVMLVLPYPPSMNSYWRNFHGRVLISKKGRLYRKRTIESVRQQDGIARFAGRLAVSIVTAQPDGRRRDIDNLMKPLLDAMAHAGVYEDDCQIDKLQITRGPVDCNPHVLVRVFEITEETR